uniref:IlGF domain-containing protein n=1 Tax=Macrostomum lignano TaxID=282301 RepID=A0A1I8HS64_9PLAT
GQPAVGPFDSYEEVSRESSSQPHAPHTILSDAASLKDPHDFFFQISLSPNSKIYKACGLPLMILMTRACRRHGGLYVPAKDPVLEEFGSLSKTTKMPPVGAGGVRNPCNRPDIGQRDPFLQCCCNYCSERTLRGFCSDDARHASQQLFLMARRARGPINKLNNTWQL